MGREAGCGGPQSLPWREIPVPVMNQTRWLLVLRDQGAFRPGVFMLSPVHHYVSPPRLFHPPSGRIHLAGSGQGGHPGPLPPRPEPSRSPALLSQNNPLPSHTPAPPGRDPLRLSLAGTHNDPLSWSPCSHSVLLPATPPTLGPCSGAKIIF